MVFPASSNNLREVAEWSGDDEFFLQIVPSTSKRGARIRDTKKLRTQSDHWNDLSDDLLVLIFGWIHSPRDRCSCAAVCRRWLMLQALMRRTDFRPGTKQVIANDDSVNKPTSSSVSTSEMEVMRPEKPPVWALGDLSRRLEGRHATDFIASAMVMGASWKGGLLTLTIKGEPDQPQLTDIGLETVSVGCPYLKGLALFDCSGIGDRSLEMIGGSCRLLERLELTRCSKLTDAALKSVAKGCCLLKTLRVESCEGVGDAGVKAVAKYCSKLVKLSLIGCPRVSERGLRSLTKRCKCLMTLKLDNVGVTDEALSYFSFSSLPLKCLTLSSLGKVTYKGLSELTCPTGFTNLQYLVLGGMDGLDDDFLIAFAKACNRLTSFALINSPKVQGHGLSAFLQDSKFLASLAVEHCPSMSFKSLFMALRLVSGPVTALRVKGRFKECSFETPALLNYKLESLTVIHCVAIGRRCLRLGDLRFVRRLELKGIASLRDAGLKEYLDESGGALVYVNLTDCVQLTSRTIMLLAEKCPSLETAIFDGCDVTDRSVACLAGSCRYLQELDVSNSPVTDAGVLEVIVALGPELRSLSLSGCEGVSGKSLDRIRRRCDNLQVLNVKNCFLTSSAVKELQASSFGGHCKILS